MYPTILGLGILLALDQFFVRQLRGGVNQLLSFLNNYAYFKIFTRYSMMIIIMQGKNNGTFNIRHIYDKHRDRYFPRNPYKVKNSSSLYDKYYLLFLHYHTFEHQLIVRLQPLFCKLQLTESTNSLFFSSTH
jgi:hypothetical protein